MLSQILGQLEKMEAEKAGRIAVRVVTAREVSADAKGKIQEQAEKLFTGKKVEAKFVVNEALIGGAKIMSDEVLFDATLATAVRELKSEMVKE